MWKGLEKNSGTSLKRQLYSYVKEIILEGKAAPGERLPSSRRIFQKNWMSQEIPFLKSTVSWLPKDSLKGNKAQVPLLRQGLPNGKEYTRKTTLLFLPFDTKEETIDFRSGIPDFSLFPQKNGESFTAKYVVLFPSQHSATATLRVFGN